ETPEPFQTAAADPAGSIGDSTTHEFEGGANSDSNSNVELVKILDNPTLLFGQAKGNPEDIRASLVDFQNDLFVFSTRERTEGRRISTCNAKLSIIGLKFLSQRRKNLG